MSMNRSSFNRGCHCTNSNASTALKINVARHWSKRAGHKGFVVRIVSMMPATAFKAETTLYISVLHVANKHP